MQHNKRYEIKFVLNEGQYTDALRWLHVHTSAVSKYPDRSVSSLYFDDVNYQSVQDNLIGIPNRQKIRFRWYHAQQAVTGAPALELKIREGRLGYKMRQVMPSLQNNLLHLRIRDIASKVNEGLTDADIASLILDKHYIPTLYVDYVRSYFEDYQGLRVTFDSSIEFGLVSHELKLNECLTKRYPYRVMELKFPPELKNRVSHMLSYLHLNTTRNSKYLVGLSEFGLITYL